MYSRKGNILIAVEHLKGMDLPMGACSDFWLSRPKLTTRLCSNHFWAESNVAELGMLQKEVGVVQPDL